MSQSNLEYVYNPLVQKSITTIQGIFCVLIKCQLFLHVTNTHRPSVSFYKIQHLNFCDVSSHNSDKLECLLENPVKILL